MCELPMQMTNPEKESLKSEIVKLYIAS